MSIRLQFNIEGSDGYSIPEEEFEDWTLGRLMDEVRDIASSYGETPDEVQPSAVDMRFTGLDLPAAKRLDAFERKHICVACNWTGYERERDRDTVREMWVCPRCGAATIATLPDTED